ncbi:MAG TPA: hypothetical protein VMC80_03720 [Patescibacteria group bacterium]|nr:hypothetical protein [Patescibacteria group bacterium]
MISESIPLPIKDTNKILLKEQVMDIFFSLLTTQFQRPFELLVKRGNNWLLKGLEFHVFALPSDSSDIYRINYTDFARDALKQIDSYRMIKGGEIYQQLPELRRNLEDGAYLLSSNGKPAFRITISPANKRYIFSSLAFETFEKGGLLRYVPVNQKEPENCPNEVQLEMTAVKDDVLYQTYRQILQNYLAK